MKLFHSILVVLCVIGFTQIVSGQNCQFSDEFESETLDTSWNHFQSNYYATNITDGKLCMTIDATECNNNCPWFNDDSAGFIYKNIVGDFDFVSIVESVEASGANQGDDIENDTQLGGIMARNGNSPSENYVFNVVGTRFDIPSIETKSTVNGSSGGGIDYFTIDSTRAELRMVREGAIFNLYSRSIGSENWILRSTIIRNDLPDTLQVGMLAYAFLSYPVDLVTKFHYARFNDVLKTNEWNGGSGMWSDPNNWSLNMVPDSSHQVVFDHTEFQLIQILPNESFKCHSISFIDTFTQFQVEGILSLKISSGCN